MVYLLIHLDILPLEQSRVFLEFQRMIHCAFVLMFHLMTRQSVLINDIDDIIKIFLYSCHNFNITFGYSKDYVPFRYIKSNFVLLLNLLNQIKVFGPVYLHWEGVKERYMPNPC